MTVDELKAALDRMPGDAVVSLEDPATPGIEDSTMLGRLGLYYVFRNAVYADAPVDAKDAPFDSYVLLRGVA